MKESMIPRRQAVYFPIQNAPLDFRFGAYPRALDFSLHQKIIVAGESCYLPSHVFAAGSSLLRRSPSDQHLPNSVLFGLMILLIFI